MATGSARSIAGFDLYKAIDSCRDLLENFGGHIYAAGLTLKLENVKEFKERFEKYVSENITAEQKIPQIEIDTELALSDINDDFFEKLGQFAPYGPENTKPIFVTSNVIDANGCKLVGQDQKHLKLDICALDNRHDRCSGIAFNVENAQKCIEHIKSKKPFHICYTLEENNFNGKKSIQLMVKDIQLT
jgi:single-stranded-DNA-specific exonuclease